MNRFKLPDKKNSESLIMAAEREIKFALTLKKSSESSATIVRNIYEGFRMLGDAILVNEGISSEDHLMPINRLIKLDVKTKKPLRLIDNLRRLRHNINYNGYSPSMEELVEGIELVEGCFYSLLDKIKEIVGVKDE